MRFACDRDAGLVPMIPVTTRLRSIVADGLVPVLKDFLGRDFDFKAFEKYLRD